MSIILNPNQSWIMPNDEEEVVIEFTGEMGDTAEIILNQISYLIGNVGGVFCWAIGGDTQYLFTVIGENIGQLTGSNYYIITWMGYGSLKFTIQRVMDFDSKIAQDKYRYKGYRYGLRGAPDGPGNDIIPQEASLYAHPKDDGDSGFSMM